MGNFNKLLLTIILLLCLSIFPINLRCVSKTFSNMVSKTNSIFLPSLLSIIPLPVFLFFLVSLDYVRSSSSTLAVHDIISGTDNLR